MICALCYLVQFRCAVRAASCAKGNGRKAEGAFLRGSLGRGGRPSHIIVGFDDQEQREGDYQKIDDGIDKRTEIDHSITYGDREATEMRLAEYAGDDLHEYILSER